MLRTWTKLKHRSKLVSCAKSGSESGEPLLRGTLLRLSKSLISYNSAFLIRAPFKILRILQDLEWKHRNPRILMHIPQGFHWGLCHWINSDGPRSTLPATSGSSKLSSTSVKIRTSTRMPPTKMVGIAWSLLSWAAPFTHISTTQLPKIL